MEVPLVVERELTAVSPVDGRYGARLKDVAKYFSELALFKYRLQVEIEYFLALSAAGIIPHSIGEDASQNLKKLYLNFSVQDGAKLKSIEAITNHDVKAVEYFLKEKAEGLGLHSQVEFIHFGLTSQDINNTAIPLALKSAIHDLYLPSLQELISTMRSMGSQWKDLPMLARTHGQPATPTRLGKEILVFVERLNRQIALLKAVPFSAKFSGATGQFNAHAVAYPNVDWPAFADRFVASLGLERQQYTTQIEHYDDLAALLDAMRRINVILTDFCRDMWMYISYEYFHLKIVKDEIGSSAMPHKVNPIDFENAEGNFGVANALLHHIAEKLPISRLQRDLTDSTVLRNLGVPFGHTLLSFKSLARALGKLDLNPAAIERDLKNNWLVVSEALQTVLRREGFPKPYEALKELTRTHEAVTEQTLAKFIDSLNVEQRVKEELKKITPFNYIGVLPKALP